MDRFQLLHGFLVALFGARDMVEGATRRCAAEPPVGKNLPPFGHRGPFMA